jgi:hypothetical protein
VSVVPSVLRVGGVQLSVAAPVVPLVAEETTMPNAGSDAVEVPSVTRIVMELKVPVAVGVPARRPVAVSKVAQDGRFTMLNVSRSPFGSRAVGVKLYAVPTLAVVGGVPLIVGAVELPPPPEAGLITMLNHSDAEVTPSVTMTATLENVPAAVGVPEIRPVEVLNVAQDGRLRTENVIGRPSGSRAVGWKEYATPTVPAGAVPVIVGEAFAFGLTTMENVGSETRVVPSETEMTMLLQVRACSANGVPYS